MTNSYAIAQFNYEIKAIWLYNEIFFSLVNAYFNNQSCFIHLSIYLKLYVEKQTLYALIAMLMTLSFVREQTEDLSSLFASRSHIKQWMHSNRLNCNWKQFQKLPSLTVNIRSHYTDNSRNNFNSLGDLFDYISTPSFGT